MKCLECSKDFEPWERIIRCTWGCEDGVYVSERDYADVLTTCHGCKGTGEQTILELDFCSDDCIQDYVYKSDEDN